MRWSIPIMLVAGSLGAYVGFVGYCKLRRRGRRVPPLESNGAVATPGLSDDTAEASTDIDSREVTDTSIARERTVAVPNIRNREDRPNIPVVRCLFEVLLVVIAAILAWAISSAEQTNLVLLQMVMIWWSLRSIGVTVPSESELEDEWNDSESFETKPQFVDHNPDVQAIQPRRLIDRKADLAGNSASNNIVEFLGIPPSPLDQQFQWTSPVSSVFEFDVELCIRHYWSFFGGDHMPEISASLIDSQSSPMGENLIYRKLQLQIALPALIRFALGDISVVEADERSVWNSRDLQLCIHSSNITCTNYLTFMDICRIRQHPSNPSWTEMHRHACFQISDSVSLGRRSLEGLIKSGVTKKAKQLATRFENHLKTVRNNDSPGDVLGLLGEPSGPSS